MTFRELRLLHGFKTGASLAAKAGVFRATVSIFDRGEATNATWDTLDKLATALGVTPQIVIAAVRESAKQKAA